MGRGARVEERAEELEETPVISVAPAASTRNARPFDWRITAKEW